MKTILLLSTLLISSNLLATPFNGYIIKAKNVSHFDAKVFSKYGEVSQISNTSFGSFVLLKPNQKFNAKALQALSFNNQVEYIEPNYIITANHVLESEPISKPKDRSFKKQWGLNNDGYNGSIFPSGAAGEDINVLKAWGITKGAKNIKVAIIDSGVEYTHPDLQNQIDVNQIELNGKPGVDDDGNGYIDDIYGYNFAAKNGDPMDGYGHGTLCAGIVGASHNSVGVAGVMANVSILPVKFLDNNGSGELIDAILAIDYAIKRGANVLSNSWGTGGKTKALEDAIVAARNAGITFVTAAGNQSSDNDTTDSYPGNFDIDNVISVGAFSSNGKMSYFSNYGKKTVHVMAPGEHIFSTYTNGQYFPESGTSMSAPFVAGVVGLMLSQDPHLTPLQIRNRLINTSIKTPDLQSSSQSSGRVDAYRALINK